MQIDEQTRIIWRKKKTEKYYFLFKKFRFKLYSKRYLHRCTSNFVNLFFCWNIEILYQFCLLRNCTFLTRCTRMIRYKRFQFFFLLLFVSWNITHLYGFSVSSTFDCWKIHVSSHNFLFIIFTRISSFVWNYEEVSLAELLNVLLIVPQYPLLFTNTPIHTFVTLFSKICFSH